LSFIGGMKDISCVPFMSFVLHRGYEGHILRFFYEFCPSLALEGHFFPIFIKFLFLM